MISIKQASYVSYDPRVVLARPTNYIEGGLVCLLMFPGPNFLESKSPKPWVATLSSVSPSLDIRIKHPVHGSAHIMSA